LYIFRTERTPGSSSGEKSLFSFALKKSVIRPTNGDINVTPASAQAAACGNENSKVKLQCIPSFSNSLAAWIPSHVDAILIKTLSFSIPASLYRAMISRAFLIFAAVSYERRASTSVDTRPGTILRISIPKSTANFSKAGSTPPCLRPYAIASVTKFWYCGKPAAV